MDTCKFVINIFSVLKSKKANVLFAFLLLSYLCDGQVSCDTLIAQAKKRLIANDYPRAIELYSNCLKEAQRLNDRFNIGNSYIGIGISYDKSGDFENALINYFKALPAYESVGNLKKQAGTLKNIGNTYRTIKSYDKADNFFEQALQKYLLAKDSVGLAIAYNDLGLLYMDQEKPDTAIQYFSTVISTFKNHVTTELIGFVLNNLGLSWIKKNDFSKAYIYFTASLNAMKEMDNDYGIALVQNNVGNMLLKQKKYKESIDFSLKGLAAGNKIQSMETVANSYENLAISYRELKDYKTSNNYFDKLLVLRDSIFQEESAKSYAEMESRYQNEKKQKEIILLKKDNAIKDLDITNQRRTRTFLIVTILLIIAIAATIYRNYAAKQKLNKALNIANDKLNEANQSKTKLLGIITHDLRTPVSNLFNFLQLQKSSPDRLSAEQQERFNNQINASAENVLDTMEDVLVWSKSQMEKFEPVTEPVDISQFFDEILNLNKTAAVNRNLELVKDSPDNLYLQTDPNFLKIILRNLMSNAVKFAPANGTIRLMAQKADRVVTITVKDNGAGMSPEHVANIFNWNNIRSDSSGLGLRLAKEFTEKLDGTITVDSVVGEGTAFMLTFKMA